MSQPILLDNQATCRDSAKGRAVAFALWLLPICALGAASSRWPWFVIPAVFIANVFGYAEGVTACHQHRAVAKAATDEEDGPL
jgi:hypothetical protein